MSIGKAGVKDGEGLKEDVLKGAGSLRRSVLRRGEASLSNVATISLFP